jgi:hypothetical protein
MNYFNLNFFNIQFSQKYILPKSKMQNMQLQLHPKNSAQIKQLKSYLRKYKSSNNQMKQ